MIIKIIPILTGCSPEEASMVTTAEAEKVSKKALAKQENQV
jgi:hypothetical protein